MANLNQGYGDCGAFSMANDPIPSASISWVVPQHIARHASKSPVATSIIHVLYEGEDGERGFAIWPTSSIITSYMYNYALRFFSPLVTFLGR
jgi:hypothetical protein